MRKTIIQILLITTTLFSYEIQLDKQLDEKLEAKTKILESTQIPLTRDDAKEIVIDKNTALMWQDDINTKTIKKNRKDAKQYCRSLVFGGFDDWYLPRVKELNSIVDVKKYNPAIKDGFVNVISGHYWTSSPNLSDIDNVINIDFKSGHSYQSNRKGRAYLRCCRGKHNSLI